MIALGSCAANSSALSVHGTISEYTLASRTRRAISWEYWAPKSTTSTFSAGAAISIAPITAPPDAPPAEQSTISSAFCSSLRVP